MPSYTLLLYPAHVLQEFRRLSSSVVAARDRAELFGGSSGAPSLSHSVRPSICRRCPYTSIPDAPLRSMPLCRTRQHVSCDGHELCRRVKARPGCFCGNGRRSRAPTQRCVPFTCQSSAAVCPCCALEVSRRRGRTGN